MNGFSYLPSPGSLHVAAANMSPMVLWLLELDWYAGHEQVTMIFISIPFRQRDENRLTTLGILKSLCNNIYFKILSSSLFFFWNFKSNCIRLKKSQRGRRKSKWKCCFIYTNWVPNNKVTWGSTGYGEWFKSKGVGTSLAVLWLRLCLPMEADQVWPLVGELRSHTPHPQKKKKKN